MPIELTEKDFEDVPAFELSEQDFLDEPVSIPDLPVKSTAPRFVSDVPLELPGGLMAASRRWEEQVFAPVQETEAQKEARQTARAGVLAAAGPLATPEELRRKEGPESVFASQLSKDSQPAKELITQSVLGKWPSADAADPRFRSFIAGTGLFGKAPTEEDFGFAAGVVNTAKGFGEFTTSPLGISTMGLGAAGGPVAHRAIGLGFLLDIFKNAPEQAKQWAETEVTGTPQQKWESRLGALASGAFAAGLGKAQVSGGIPKFRKEIAEVRGRPEAIRRETILTPEQLRAPAAPEVPTSEKSTPAVEAVSETILSPEGYEVLGNGRFRSDKLPPDAINVSKTSTKVGKGPEKTTYTFSLPAKEIPPAAAPEAKPVSEALKDLPTVPEGKVRLYRGEGGTMPESSELGGDWYTTNPEKAAQFGPKLQYVDVTPEEAAAARQRAKDKGRGGDTVILTKENLAKTKPVPGEVAPKVHDLEASVEAAKPAPNLSERLEQAGQRGLKAGVKALVEQYEDKLSELEKLEPEAKAKADKAIAEAESKFKIARAAKDPTAFDKRNSPERQAAVNQHSAILEAIKAIKALKEKAPKPAEATPAPEPKPAAPAPAAPKAEKPATAAEPAPASAAREVAAPEAVPAQALGIAPQGTALVQKAIGNVRRNLQAFGTMFRARSNRKLMDQTFDAADNKAIVSGQQAGTSLRIGSKKLDREAAMAIVESGGDKENLSKFLLQANKNPEAKAAVRHAMNNWDRLQPLANRTRAQLDAQIQDENAAGINTEFREDYVPHIYDMDLMMGAGRPFVISGKGGGVATGFKKGRTFNTIFDAIEAGYTPKTLDVADLVEHRVKVGQRLINRKQWAEGLRSVEDPTDKNPVVTSLERKQRGPQGDWYETAPMGYVPREILPGVRIAVHEGYAPLFDALTGNSRIAASVPGRILLNVAGGIKHGLLAFDTFHASRIIQRELFLTGKVSYKKGQTLLEYSDADLGRAVNENLITQEMADWAKANRENSNLLLDAGLNVGKVQEALYSGVIRNIRGIGTFNKWVFEKLTRGAMLESGLIELERLQSARPDLSPEQAARQVSRDLNAYFGNLGRQGVFKSQTMQDMARLVMLAPNWVEGMARTEVKGGLQALKGVTYDPVAHQALLTGSIGKGMAQGLLAYFLGTQILNLSTRKQFTWQNNEEGHKLDAWIPQIGTEGGGYFISPFSVQAEITHDMLRYAKTEPSTLDAAARVLMNKSSPYWRAGKILLQGKDWDRKQVTDNWDRAKKAAVALAPTPIPLSPLTRQSPEGALQRQLTASAGFKTEPAGSPLQQIGHKASQFMEERGLKPKGTEIVFTDDPSYQNMRQAIRSGNRKEAQKIITELEKTKPLRQIIDAQRTYAERPLTGSETHEREFLRSLSDADRDLYWKAREQKKEELKKFYQMLP